MMEMTREIRMVGKLGLNKYLTYFKFTRSKDGVQAYEIKDMNKNQIYKYLKLRAYGICSNLTLKNIVMENDYVALYSIINSSRHLNQNEKSLLREIVFKTISSNEDDITSWDVIQEVMGVTGFFLFIGLMIVVLSIF